ncbi:YL1-domain-containing protein [Eremomyces bilateralis CBS 781.70]|uniref:YL1-domain-containing protein n=1 Tax=Eremomyces bilateralis CBS 781.70 TaxID=1392243 RepID=A0A6G1G3T0_9PEZI|nr:YL1-domain-containing protein [Eremomyces bilateralis CBS 781.70]KAF1812591.1 YL1-domain-containing protein [Eremomyces bilateralis CBS 781.70]
MSDDDDRSASSSSEEDNGPSMVVSRSRRSNAGNLMSRLLALEESEQAAQTEYDSMWQEEADDQEFGGEAAEDQGDISLESSSDEDEDEGEGDEEAGERELKKQERAEGTGKKRKRGTVFQQVVPRKKVKAAMPPGTGPASEGPVEAADAPPKKKPERVSWLPTDADGPKRVSSRKLAQMNRVETQERLQEKEKHRLRTLAIMQAAEARRDREKPKAMTQAEHLAEAAAVERQNSNSLNRWEEAEKMRMEEQAAKLEAMKNRKLEGAFVRYWSGPAVWMGEEIKHVGKDGDVKAIEEAEIKKQEAEIKKQQTAVTVPSAPPVAQHPLESGSVVAGPMDIDENPVQPSHTDIEQATTGADHGATGPTQITAADEFLEGIEYWASLPDKQGPVQPVIDPPPKPDSPKPDSPKPDSPKPDSPKPDPPQPMSQPQSIERDQNTLDVQQQMSSASPIAPQAPEGLPDVSLQPPQVTEEQPVPSQPPAQIPQEPSASTLPSPPPKQELPIPPPPPAILATRNLITVVTPDLPTPPTPPSKTSKPSKHEPRDTLALLKLLLSYDPSNPRALPPPTKPPKRPKATATAATALSAAATDASHISMEPCIITGTPAHFRDPGTGLPYADARAYRLLKSVLAGGCRWSALLGCYVGTVVTGGRGAPAAGVPGWFADGTVAEEGEDGTGGGAVGAKDGKKEVVVA